MHIFSAVNTPVTGTFTARSLLFTHYSSLLTLHLLRESTHTRCSNRHLGGTKTPQMYTGG
jgi:hypothetical protein